MRALGARSSRRRARSECGGGACARRRPQRDAKKGKDASRTAAWLLYCLGADAALSEYAEDADQVVAGFALAARARAAGAWQTMAAEVARENGLGDLTRELFAILKAEASGEVGPIVEALDQMTANRAGAAARYVVGTHSETALGEHYVVQLAKGAAKDKKRAEDVLTGLADPRSSRGSAATYDRGEVEAMTLSVILARAGGDQAVGCLLDISRERGVAEIAATRLARSATPSAAPRLFGVGTGRPTMFLHAEMALVGLGDGAVDYLAAELRERRDRDRFERSGSSSRSRSNRPKSTRPRSVRRASARRGRSRGPTPRA